LVAAHGSPAPNGASVWVGVVASLALALAVMGVSFVFGLVLGLREDATAEDLRARSIAHLAFATPSLYVGFANVANVLHARPALPATWIIFWAAMTGIVLLKPSLSLTAAVMTPTVHRRLAAYHGISAILMLLLFVLPHIVNHVVGLRSGAAHIELMKTVIVFKELGATFVAQEETAHIMEHVQPKEMARRIDGFVKRGLDPAEVKLVLPDVTFGDRMTIRLGRLEIRLFYLGPGQQAGDTFVAFPQARVLFTPGAFAKHSMPNMLFTPSVDNWIKLLGEVGDMDVDTILPAHGDAATRADVKELAAMLADEYATVKDAVNRGVSLDRATATLTFPQYRDWRNYTRLQGEIKALYELIETGKRSYLE
jgi:glyoxylase-like metal-dependent hydrolase (beta-lactamase superfamily II)